MKEGRSAFKILSGNPTGKRPQVTPRTRCADHIRIDFKEKVVNTINWIDSTQERDYWRALVNSSWNFRVL